MTRIRDRTDEVETLPCSQKLCITIKEASEYSGLPVSAIKEMLKDPDCPFRLSASKKGRKPLIKRIAFENYLMKD